MGISLGGGLSFINPVAAIGTALSFGESALAYKGQKDANESNERIAKENRAFQERMANSAMDYQDESILKAQAFEQEMSNTAYQRGMTDMKKAGLNPILAYQKGGASTPIGKTAPGVMAPGSVATMQNPFQGMTGSPTQVASTAAGLGKTMAETDKVRQDIRAVGKSMKLTDQQIRKVESEVRTLDEQLRGIEDENVAKDIIAKHFEEYPSSALAAHFGGKSVFTLGSALASTGITKYVKYLKETIDRVKNEFNFSPSWSNSSSTTNTSQPGFNPLTDRY